MMYLTTLETERDKVVFQKLYEENCHRLYWAALKIVRNNENAEDAVQNGFFNIVKNYQKYCNQSYENLEKLCYIAVKNAAIDIVRSNAKHSFFFSENGFTEENIPDVVPDILEELIKKQEKSFVAQAISELEEEEQKLIYLQYVKGLKPKEIGEMTEMTSAAVRKKTFNSRNKLAKSLANKGFEKK